MNDMDIHRHPLVDRVKRTVLEIEASAEVRLYGSRARGTAGSESDWDFLILVDGVVDEKRKAAIRYPLYRIEWETGEVLSSIIHAREHWDNPPTRITPFYQNVVREGV